MLRVNQLIGFGARRLSSALVAIGSYIGTNVNTANQNVYTFTDEPIGAAHASRLVVVGVALSSAAVGTFRTVGASGTSIGGVAATVHSQSGADNVGTTAFISAVVPTGTTGTIIIDLTGVGTALACRIFVYRVLAASSTPVDDISTANTAGTALNDLSVSSGGWFAAMALNNGTQPIITWSGTDAVTTDYNSSVENAEVTIISANTAQTSTGDDLTSSQTAHMSAVSFV